jgi:FkbM family methyltransferase
LELGRILRGAFVTVRRYVNCVRLLGGSGVTLVLRTLLGSRSEVRVRISGQVLFLRLNTTDLETLLQMFWNREYEFELAAEPATIVDAGANVGYASVYFASRFPRAKILAIEPEAANFAQLQKNVAGNRNIVPIQAALWNEDTSLTLVDAGAGSWGFRVSSQESSESRAGVRAVAVPTLMSEHEMDTIDILKLDVEGSEKEIFESSADWINSVGVIVAELHDKYRMGCARAFYNATNGFAHEARLGENILLRREAFLPREVSGN